jgi:hypothetical protein
LPPSCLPAYLPPATPHHARVAVLAQRYQQKHTRHAAIQDRDDLSALVNPDNLLKISVSHTYGFAYSTLSKIAINKAQFSLSKGPTLVEEVKKICNVDYSLRRTDRTKGLLMFDDPEVLKLNHTKHKIQGLYITTT